MNAPPAEPTQGDGPALPVERRVRRPRAAFLSTMIVPVVLVGGLLVPHLYKASARAAVAVRVVGNQLVDGAGQPMRLLGVDRSGSEYACVQGWGFFDGPVDAAAVASIAAWHTDAVRVPLNEDCWLGINGVSATFSGRAYRGAIETYANTLRNAGIAAVLDLHWNAAGTASATGQQVMADADHASAFWASVARSFKANPDVVFDLYNEPHDISWACWRNGCNAGGWQTAGMQSLVNAVRSTGATQPLMLGGVGWSSDLSGWLAYEPTDPDHQLVASVHLYNFSGCNTLACWNQTIAPVAAEVPVVTGEVGETDCAQGFVDTYLPWADAHGVSYLGWAWDTGGGWTCGSGPSLIASYQGNATAYGAGLQSHLAALNAGRGGSTATTAAMVPATTTVRAATSVRAPTTVLAPSAAPLSHTPRTRCTRAPSNGGDDGG